MHSLKDLGILRGNNYVIESHLGGIANHLSKRHKLTDVALSDQLREFALGLLRLRYTSLHAYERCVRLSSRATDAEGLDSYVQFGLASEFAFYFIVTSKSCLDLTACVIKAIESQKHQDGMLVDINNLKSQRFNNAIKSLRGADWFEQLRTARNEVIHRGAHVGIKVNTATAQYYEEIKRLMSLPGWPLAVSMPSVGEFQNELVIALVKTSFSAADQNTIIEDWAIKGHEKVRALDLGRLAEGMTREYDRWELALAKEIAEEDFNGILPEPVMSIFSYLDFP